MEKKEKNRRLICSMGNCCVILIASILRFMPIPVQILLLCVVIIVLGMNLYIVFMSWIESREKE